MSSERAVRATTFARYRRSLLAGVVAAVVVLVLGAGATVLLAPASQWTHESRLLVVPAPTTEQGSVAGFYETLNSGQLVQTYAEVLRSALRASDSQGEGPLSLNVDVQVVPDTSILSVRVVADEAEIAATRGPALAAEAVALVRGLGEPYVLRDVSPDGGRLSESGGLAAGDFAVVAVLALLAGGAMQQLWVRVEPPGSRRRRG